MNGRFSSDSPICELEDAGIGPETSVPSPRGHGFAADLKATHHLSSASSSSPKRSRRSVQKRVVTVPIVEADGSRPKGAGEGAPPSDSWAWRKYGQKPIKGSPYPRGYYRCSSSKGCPARKQVERSRTDPTMLVVTYACEHNHPWPLPKNHHHQRSTPSAPSSNPSPSPSHEDDPAPQIHFSPPDPADPEDKFSDLIGEEPSLMMRHDYYWFSDVGSPSTTSPPGSTDDLLLGSIVGSADMVMTFPSDCYELGGGGEEEEDSLFAGLGELPECSVVFRRGFLERQMLMQGEESRQCGLAASR